MLSSLVPRTQLQDNCDDSAPCVRYSPSIAVLAVFHSIEPESRGHRAYRNFVRYGGSKYRFFQSLSTTAHSLRHRSIPNVDECRYFLSGNTDATSYRSYLLVVVLTTSELGNMSGFPRGEVINDSTNCVLAYYSGRLIGFIFWIQVLFNRIQKP